jgi:N-acetylglucosaminyldiphosphoundecaprenol N-acetyl-beta-D-mannosaminyltransferase
MTDQIAVVTGTEFVAGNRIERINILGVGVSAINPAMAVSTIDRWLKQRSRQYVCVADVHSIMECQRDEGARHICNAAGLVTPDGMPLAWLLKFSGYRYADRVCGSDLMFAVFEQGEKRGYRHFLYGSSERTLQRLKLKLERCFPGARIVGSISPPFRPLSTMEDRAIVAAINDSGADIVWVGLGAPKQERWMADHRRALDAPILIGVGAAFDFHAGLVRRAPRFLQRSGLEWLFRLYMEPRRLWRRYLTNNPQFLVDVAAQWAGLRRYPDPTN